MRVRITTIGPDLAGPGYCLEVEEGVWLPDCRDYMACEIVGVEGVVATLQEANWTKDAIDKLLDRTYDGEFVDVENVFIEVKDAETRARGGIGDIIDMYNEYGYVLNDEGNPVEIDAPSSPLRQLGMV